MIQNIRLAQSYWPRSGYDQKNRSHVPFTGAEHGKIVHEITLPSARKDDNHGICGSVMSDMMTLRVVCEGILSAISIDGKIIWSIELCEAENKPCEYYSLPVALQDGACLIALSDSICVYNSDGRLVLQQHMPDFDDTGCAPNITESGQILHSSINGEIWCIEAIDIRAVGCFGYDVLPPAIYPDSSLAIAGYYGDGFCRASIDGQMVWKTEFKEADMLPTINQDNIAAVGSKNDNKSTFYSPEGKLLGTYDRASVFAEYSPDSWIARSNKRVAKLTVEGKECWKYSLRDDTYWGRCQPIVDSEGRVYLLDDNQLICFTGEGEIVFSIEIQDSYDGLGCVTPGRMAYVGKGLLQIIE